MKDSIEMDGTFSRREALRQSGCGLGLLALAHLLADEQPASAAGQTPGLGRLHHPPRAKAVIQLFMNGGPSQMDTFDPKPALVERAGQTVDKDRPDHTLMPSPFTFSRHGESGIEISSVYPHLARVADELCVIRSMRTEVPDHEQGLRLMNCGDSRLPRPSIGSWLLYGLGAEHQNLPGFVAMCPNGYPLESDYWQSAFLPSIYQATYIDTQHTQVERLLEHIRSRHTSPGEQRPQLDLLRKLNERHLESRADDERLEARLRSFELAFQMQSDAAEAFDLRREPRSVRALYGDGVQGRQLLTARRLVQRGVRYVQCWAGEGLQWDHHDNLADGLLNAAAATDQAMSALLTDLRQQGMLDETLVIWGGEFGRLATADQAGTDHTTHGRGHNHKGFSMWLAGGGVRRGHVHGATDELGETAVENPVSVHDLHATILHLMGFDHRRLVYRYAGRDFRLTDVSGNLVEQLLA